MVGGSVVLSKNSGNYEILGDTNGLDQFQTPNYEVNRADSREPFDRPVVVKLFGSVALPVGREGIVQLPLHSGGAVEPHRDRAAAGRVGHRQRGLHRQSRRSGSSPGEIDATSPSATWIFAWRRVFRLASSHQMGLYLDLYNATGFSYLNFQSNPGGTWAPTNVNVTTGTYSPASLGARSQVGVRTIQFGVRYNFN